MVCMCVRGHTGGWSFLRRQSSTDPILLVAHFTNVSTHSRPGRHHTSNPHRWERLPQLTLWERVSPSGRPSLGTSGPAPTPPLQIYAILTSESLHTMIINASHGV